MEFIRHIGELQCSKLVDSLGVWIWGNRPSRAPNEKAECEDQALRRRERGWALRNQL